MDWLWQAVVGNGAYGLLVAALLGLMWRWQRNRRDDFFLPIVLTDSESMRDNVRGNAAGYFSSLGMFRRTITGLPHVDLTRVAGSQAELVSSEMWRELLVETLRTLRKANDVAGRRSRERLHVVFGTLSLWNFALGTMLKNRHALRLYHFQNGDYHFIWEMDRRVKNLQSPKAGQPFEHRFFRVTPGTASAKRECLVVHVGTHPIGQDVERYRAAHLPDASLRVLTKVRDLDPKNPTQWIRAAAELTHAICDQTVSQATELYLFTDAPAVLMLMAGDAIGDYSRRVCLMQLVKSSSEQDAKTYREVLRLPDPELSKLAG
ncbi:MAG: SAVED domain-containing protein [Planctomycetaceae bacterium]|nr:SAVED domain-containing protein [Planctomycetaceae bacterium]